MRQKNIYLVLPFLLSILLCNNKSYAQCPPNLDFEDGNFNNWQCYTGITFVQGGQNVIQLVPSPPTVGRHEIITASTPQQLDFYGQFPQLCPYGGNYSVKLGNNQTGNQAEGLSYTFTVPPGLDTFTFTYFYAVVFQDPSHNAVQQPRFFVTAYDVLSGALINCASYNYISSGGIPGFDTSLVNPTVLYKNWSPASIQFAGLANRQVRLEFKTGDCTLGGHFGYAYVDVGSGCSNILATAPYCAETNSILLNAPYGFQSYTWYNHDYSIVVGNQQNITLSPPPATSGIFHVDMIPYPGYGCRDTAHATVLQLPVPDTPVAISEYIYCQYQPAVVLTAAALTGNDLLWYTTATGGIPGSAAPVPSTTTAGIFEYYVSQKKLFGCESLRKKITVKVNPEPAVSFTINQAIQCLKNNSFIFTSTSTNLVNPVYEWRFGDGQVQSGAGPVITHTYAVPGNYTVTLHITNEAGCPSQKTMPVTVNSNPVAVIGAPPVICEQQTQVAFTDNSFMPAGTAQVNQWWWNMNGVTVTVQNPVPFIINQPGTYPVQLVVGSSENCFSDTTSLLLPVRYRPVAAFTVSRPLCNNGVIQFTSHSYMPPNAPAAEQVTNWNWNFGGGAASTQQHPGHQYTAGAQQAQLVAISNFGCMSLPDDTAFLVHPKPAITVNLSDSCINKSMRFEAADLHASVNNWYWNLGSGTQQAGAIVPFFFNQPVAGMLTLTGITAFGCADTLQRRFTIYENRAFVQSDTAGPVDEPIQLNVYEDPAIQYTWSPAAGLSSTIIAKPVAILGRDQLYNLYTITKEGCERSSNILVRRYKGPDIYVPTGFTPNNDGVNDILYAVAYGVNKIKKFTVYNRYGHIVFHTTDVAKGWDGKLKGVESPAGAYVFIVEGTDIKGRAITRKGTVMLIR